MTLVIVLCAAGILLLAIEVVVPGGVLGAAGGGAILAGVIAAFARFGFDGGMAATVVALLVAAVVFYLEFVLLPKTRLGRAMLDKLKVYAGGVHPHQAQQPAPRKLGV